MDMIGRLKDSSLIVYGTGTSSSWKDILNKYNDYGFKLTFNDEGFGPSDHSSFYGKKFLFYFSSQELTKIITNLLMIRKN